MPQDQEVINTSTSQWINEQDTYDPFGSPRLAPSLMDSIVEGEGAVLTDDPNDPGGATKFGIAYNYNQDDVKKYGINSAADMDKLTRDQADEIFYNKYYEPSNASELPFEARLAYLNTYINSPTTSVKALQEAVGASVDGVYGDQTRMKLAEYLNSNSAEDLSKAIRKNYVKKLVESDNWDSFGNGWVNRFLETPGKFGKNKVNLNQMTEPDAVFDAIKDQTGIDLN